MSNRVRIFFDIYYFSKLIDFFCIKDTIIAFYTYVTFPQINFQEQFEMAVNHELAAKYNGMQLRDSTELNQATKVLNKHNY